MTRVTHIFALSEKPGRHVWGGAESSLKTLLPEFVAQGIEVEALALIWNDGKYIQDGLSGLADRGVSVTRLYRLPHAWWRTRIWRGVHVLIRLLPLLLRRRQHIIHIHLDFFFVPALLFLVRARCVVMTLHNDEPHWASFFGRLWLRLLNRLVRQFIAISENVREHFANRVGIPTKKITTVYYGISTPNSRPVDRAQFGLEKSAFVVGFVGRLTLQKGLSTFIEALASRPHFTGLLIGDGEQKRELEALAGQLGATNILFWGAREDARTLMPLFDVFCLPSRWEGLGLVLLEAMINGVPVVGSDAGAIPEILGDGEYGGVFKAGDVNDLLRQLDDAFRERDRWRARARKACDRCLKEFTPEASAQRTVQVYRATSAELSRN